jgi:aspartyl protease family protein
LACLSGTAESLSAFEVRGGVAGGAWVQDLPRSLKHATIWLLLGAALFVALQTWQARELAARFSVDGAGAVEIRRSRDGHYHWPGRVGGRMVDFLVDTGATRSAIPAALARDLRLAELGRARTQTAAGPTEGIVVAADIELQGGIRAERLRLLALPGLGAPLLGMDILGRLHWRQDGGVLRIEPGRGAPR